MRPLCVSTRGLIFGMAGIPLAFAVLRFSTPTVASAVILLTAFTLCLAIVAAVSRHESRRAYWVGFALIGGGYLALSSGSWRVIEKERSLDGGFRDFMTGQIMGLEPPEAPSLSHWLGTTSLLDQVRVAIQEGDRILGPTKHRAGFLGYAPNRSGRLSVVLERTIDMPFGQETALDDVFKYIRSSTRGPDMPEGVPIYVDPYALAEVQKTMASPVVLDVQGLPLRVSLLVMLRQLDLTYAVDDGLLTISTAHLLADSRRVESFRRIGHCVIALVFGLIGGLTARVLHATRDPRERVVDAT
jgi:hypothetical protein